MTQAQQTWWQSLRARYPIATRTAEQKRRDSDSAKIGRPEKDIDLDELGKIAGLQCTYDDAADWFGVSLSTFKRRMAISLYREVWDRGRGKGRTSLRRAQFELSKKNATMAIFLGKQWLDQRDVVNQELSVKDGKALEFTIRFANDDIGGDG